MTPCSTIWSTMPITRTSTSKSTAPASCRPAINWQSPRAKFSPRRKTPAAAIAAKPYRSIGAIPGTPKFFDNWNLGFNLAWELDFWGLYRRQVLAAKAQLDASVENYDAVLVTLLSDVSQYYVTMRQTQEQIELTKQNAKLQRDVLKIVQARLDAGTVTELDVAQQQTTLSQIEATIPAFEITLAAEPGPALHLVGHSAHRPAGPAGTAADSHGARAKWWWAFRRSCWSGGPISAAPNAPPRPRPSKSASPRPNCIPTSRSPARWATRPTTPRNCSPPPPSTAASGRRSQWNILNYGRLANNVRLQDAKFQQTLLDYRTAVLTANQEAEDGLVAFLKSQEQTKMLTEAVVAADKAYQIVVSPVSRGHGRLQPPRHPRNQPGDGAGFPGPGPRFDRLGPGPGLSGVGRRLGDPSWPGGGIRIAVAQPRLRRARRTCRCRRPSLESGRSPPAQCRAAGPA